MLFYTSLFVSLCSISALKVLVLGGTGFVGQKFIQLLVETRPDIEVVAVSRRGVPSIDGKNKMLAVKYLSADAGDINSLRSIHAKYGPFDSCLHCVGLLLDKDSGLSALNKFASGSGSSPDETSTYDKVTRQTALNAIQTFTEYQGKGKPFVFISAAEAGWTFKAPVNFLERYLAAKRAVESELLRSELRPIIFRPSLIWTSERPQGLVSVIPFYIGNKLGIPFIDRPVRVETLVQAIVVSMFYNTDTRGVLNYKDIESLGKSIIYKFPVK